jgi:hypothetical protein
MSGSKTAIGGGYHFDIARNRRRNRGRTTLENVLLRKVLHDKFVDHQRDLAITINRIVPLPPHQSFTNRLVLY